MLPPSFVPTLETEFCNPQLCHGILFKIPVSLMHKNGFAQYWWPVTSIWARTSTHTGKSLGKLKKDSASSIEPYPSIPTHLLRVGARLGEVQVEYISAFSYSLNQVLLCALNFHDATCSCPAQRVLLGWWSHTKYGYAPAWFTERQADALVSCKSPLGIVDKGK